GFVTSSAVHKSEGAPVRCGISRAPATAPPARRPPRPHRWPARSSPASPGDWPWPAWSPPETPSGRGPPGRTADRARPGGRPSTTRSMPRRLPAPPSLLRLGTRFARRVDEIPEELGFGRQQHAGIAVLQPGFERLHGAVEREEIRVAPERVGEDAVALGIALAADLLAPRRGIGDDHGGVAVGPRPDLLGALLPLRAELGRLALAFGLHPAVHGLAVLLRQVGAADAHVHHVDAEGVRLAVELLADPLHQLRTLVAHHLDEGGLAEDAAERGDQQRCQPRIGALDRADRLVELQRVVDAVAREGVHHEALLVGGNHLL